MSSANKPDIRATLLKVIEERQPRGPTDSALQTNGVLQETAIRIETSRDISLEQALLTQWHELFRTGYLAWGHNLNNTDPPFFHLTSKGRQALAQLSRDPANPDGYLRHLYSIANLSPITKSYLEEGLRCYVASLYKSSAVMIGAAAESIILELRDSVISKHASISNLKDWRVKRVLNGLKSFFDSQKSNLPNSLWEEYEAYWSAFTQQIRATRNEAGHPTNVDPVTAEAVHAGLLIFPELCQLANRLDAWLKNEIN